MGGSCPSTPPHPNRQQHGRPGGLSTLVAWLQDTHSQTPGSHALKSSPQFSQVFDQLFLSTLPGSAEGGGRPWQVGREGGRHHPFSIPLSTPPPLIPGDCDKTLPGATEKPSPSQKGRVSLGLWRVDLPGQCGHQSGSGHTPPSSSSPSLPTSPLEVWESFCNGSDTDPTGLPVASAFLVSLPWIELCWPLGTGWI